MNKNWVRSKLGRLKYTQPCGNSLKITTPIAKKNSYSPVDMSQVKFGIETTVYQGFCLIYVTELYNVSHFAGISADTQQERRQSKGMSL
ncbi:hypothetical protein [Nostoc sp. WHI]|uniref:hypothetical protein n=1 Tax=Nostoc sp. WHI TaxID=2650611 RepID=UPI0018C561E3|nr:hypothetical protein [Nostoc sp. WHI]